MTSRGEFLSSLTAGAAIACAPPAFSTSIAKPHVVRRGDRVGLVSPASPLDPGELARGVAHIRSLGLEPVVGRYADTHYGYLAGSDEERADDFNRMARDSRIRAIVALRGGYGTMRILDHIDYDALRADPKVVMGFSDMTALLNAISRRSNIITFHGPVASRDTSFNAADRAMIEDAWMSTKPIGMLRAPSAQRLRGGRARGPLAGGNLSLIASLTGTPYAIAASGSLLVIEETEEEPYRIDRMLTQLRLAGSLSDAHGIVVGRFTDCDAKGASLTIDQVLESTVIRAGRPAIAGVPVGHFDEQWVLPIGLPAELDAETRSLHIDEAAVAS